MRSIPFVLAGWLSRLMVVSCGLLNARLLLSIMDISDYAAFAIVVSLGPWVNLLNFGLPNTAQNEIAQRRAKAEDYNALRQTVVNAALFCALIIGLLSWPFGLLLQLTVLSSFKDLSYTGLVVMCIGLGLNALSMVANQVLFALHRSLWPNFMPGIQALVTTVLLVIFQKSHCFGLQWGALSFAIPATLSFVVLSFVAEVRPQLGVNVNLLISVLRRSGSYLLFTFLSAATLSVDFIIMARVLSEADVFEYSLVGKVFAVLLSVHAVLLSNSWTSLSDAHFEGKLWLVRQRVSRLLMAGIAIVLLPSIAILLFKQDIFLLITGALNFQISTALMAVWIIYLILRVWCDTFALAHASAGNLAILNSYIPVQAAISVGAQILLSRHYGSVGVMLGLCASFALTAAWILPVRFFQKTRPAPLPQ